MFGRRKEEEMVTTTMTQQKDVDNRANKHANVEMGMVEWEEEGMDQQ